MADESKETIESNTIIARLIEEKLIDSQALEDSLKEQLNIEQEIMNVASKENALASKLKNIQKEISRIEENRRTIGEHIEKTGIFNVDYEKQLLELSTKLKEQKLKELAVRKDISKAEEFDKALSRLKLKGLYDAMAQLHQSFKAHKFLGVVSVLTAGFLSFLKIFKNVDEAGANFRRSMGLLRPTTAELEKNVRAMYFDLAQTGVEAKDFYEALQAGAATMGTYQSTTMAMVKDMGLMAAQLGVAQTTSAAFAMSMGMAAKQAMDTQRDISLFAFKLSEAAGTNLNEVMLDVANATKTSYTFMAKQPAVLVKAAVEAKRMGTSLSDAAKSAASLINFTESVNAEMQASVLLGESINLQRLRELSYRKKLGDVNKEILDIANKTHFDDLDPFQQEAVAKALGKSADEVGKMLQGDREMRRIRSDGSLTKQVASYDKLLNANKDLVKLTAEGAKNELKSISNQQSLQAIALSLKSIYQSMFQPLVEIAAIWLPKIATFLNTIKEASNVWIAALAGGIMFIGGPLVLGKLLSLAKAGIFKLFGKDVAAGAEEAGKGVRGLLGKIASGMGSLEKIATSIGRIIVKLGVAVGRGIGSVLQFTLRGLALGLKALGTPQVLIGAIVLGVVGLAFMAFGKAAQFVAAALKDLQGVGLAKIAGGLALVGVAMLPLALVTPLMLPLAIGMFAFGGALRFVMGPAERMGAASVKLGEGLEKTANSLAQIANLNMISVIKQFKDLTEIICNLSKEFNSIPDIKIEKIQDIIIKSSQMAGEATDKANEKVIATLMDIKNAVDALRNSLEKGGIAANVMIDSQKLDQMTARSLSFRGTNSPQPSFF